MKPEKTGNVEGSAAAGGVNRAVTVWVLPGPRVNLEVLRDTEAKSVERGTGPSAGNIVPGVTVTAVPAGMCLSV